jgi:hypothetical protein
MGDHPGVVAVVRIEMKTPTTSTARASPSSYGQTRPEVAENASFLGRLIFEDNNTMPSKMADIKGRVILTKFISVRSRFLPSDF